MRFCQVFIFVYAMTLACVSHAQTAPVQQSKNSIVKHFRFTEGEAYVPAPLPTPPIDMIAKMGEFKAQMLESVKEMPNIDEIIKKGMVPPVIGSCLLNTSSDTKLNETFPEGLEGELSPSFDLLFLDEKELPEDYETIFGVTTLVVPFVRSQPNLGWNLISEIGVPCLPYRLRFQGNKIYRDEGITALKNYSKSTKGSYHPYIQSKYEVK